MIGNIYMLRNKNNFNEFYIGCTKQKLNARLSAHKQKSLLFPNRLLYNTINNNWDNWDITLIRDINYDNRNILEEEENKIILEMKPTLNKNKLGKSNYKKKYYTEERKLKMREYMKKRYNNGFNV